MTELSCLNDAGVFRSSDYLNSLVFEGENSSTDSKSDEIGLMIEPEFPHEVRPVRFSGS